MIPDFAFALGGADRTDQLRRLLAELRVVTTTDRESDSVEIAISDHVRELAEPRRGREIEVRLGYDDVSLLGTGVMNWNRVIDPRQITDIYLLAMAAERQGGAALLAPPPPVWSPASAWRSKRDATAPIDSESRRATSLTAMRRSSSMFSVVLTAASA